jgi:hypothetical protein
MTQTAYRSLYWDDTKAKMVDGVKNTATGTQSTAIANAQLANYQAALNRLNSSSHPPWILIMSTPPILAGMRTRMQTCPSGSA